MKSISKIILFIFFSQALIAQKLIIGKVVDNIYLHPLDSIEISINGKILFSDAKGQFSFIYKKLPLDLVINDYRYFPKSIMVNDTDLVKIKLTNRGLVLDELIVKTDLFSKKLKNVSLATSILDDIEFRKNEGEFLINSLNQVNGIYSHSAGYNTNRITIRGMGSRSPYSTNKIKAYLNNIPLSNGVGETTIEDFGIEILDQIEINKGPNSSIYGSPHKRFFLQHTGAHHGNRIMF